MNALRIAAVQMPHGDALEANLRVARERLERAREAGVDLALLPEYFFATGDPGAQAAHAEEVHGFLARSSRELGLAVAANVVERDTVAAFNVGLVYDRGVPIARQRKVHPMPRESAGGIAGGADLSTFTWRDVSAGMLVCADILYPEASRILSLQGARLLLNPVMSAYRAYDPTREAREALYVARAWDAGAFVVKAGGYRSGAIAGRSLIAAPWGLLARYRGDFEDDLLVAELDFDILDAFRKDQQRFPARRPDAYSGLL